MADFEISYQRLLWHIEKYIKNEKDEVFFGISRRAVPEWEGWEEIEFLKSSPLFPANLNDIISLKDLVREYYFVNYQTPLRADEYPSQRMADMALLLAVLSDVPGIISVIQHIINFLGNNGERHSRVRITGIFDDSTLKGLNSCYRGNSEKLLLNLMIVQGMSYVMQNGRPENQRSFREIIGKMEMTLSYHR